MSTADDLSSIIDQTNLALLIYILYNIFMSNAANTLPAATTIILRETAESIEFNFTTKWTKEFAKQLRGVKRVLKQLRGRDNTDGIYTREIDRVAGLVPEYTQRHVEMKARHVAAKKAL